MMKSSVLITGATGFVGQNLKPFLEKKGKNVIPINLRRNWQLDGRFECDSIIHLAGKAHETRNSKISNEYFEINTKLTQELFDFFRFSRSRDFVYFSSVKASADTISGVLNEEQMPNPMTLYGQSKLKAEEYIMSCSLPIGKRVIILRPCMIHGPGNKGNLNLLYQVIKKGFPYPLVSFENKRSFLSIDNLNYVIDKLLDNTTIPSGIYNVADDEPLSTKAIIEIMGEGINVKPKFWKLSPSFIKLVAKLGDKLHLPLTTDRLKKLTENYIVSNEKLKNVLGIHEFPISSRNGLLRTIKSFGESV